MNELERKLQRARNEMIAERFGRITRPAARYEIVDDGRFGMVPLEDDPPRMGGMR